MVEMGLTKKSDINGPDGKPTLSMKEVMKSVQKDQEKNKTSTGFGGATDSIKVKV